MSVVTGFRWLLLRAVPGRAFWSCATHRFRPAARSALEGEATTEQMCVLSRAAPMGVKVRMSAGVRHARREHTRVASGVESS